jgi:hypothetical protein
VRGRHDHVSGTGLLSQCIVMQDVDGNEFDLD